MRPMTELESKIYEDGCRLIPGVSHDKSEWFRHKSRYEFFRKVILADLRGPHSHHFQEGRSVSIVDLGCGVGYGSSMLAEVPDSRVVGIDLSDDAIRYASQRYGRSNVEYRVADIHDVFADSEEWDYVVAHEVIEHLPDGFSVLSRLRFKERVLVSTPYEERAGNNPHHLMFNITEASYAAFPDKEFFYGDGDGRVYDSLHKPDVPLTLLCVINGTRRSGAGLRRSDLVHDRKIHRHIRRLLERISR